MPFIFGKNYTRDEIHAELGGDTQSFLPWSGGWIARRATLVAGCNCFRQAGSTDGTEGNYGRPDAPMSLGLLRSWLVVDRTKNSPASMATGQY